MHLVARERPVHHAYNGMAATELRGVVWQKSKHSNSQGSCVEFARLPGGNVAMRNSRHPEGPALVYTPAEIEAMLLGVKDGEFDHLIAGA
ncbi:putative regulator [Streptomyces clavuligerus]|uniref:Putative regulator n=1 Tax=Streptomyces clavuligerus TaxID=1901 RepID=E2Q8L4_STRCL|nr:putative regulator [Streptomyces clavuligerus]